MVSFFFGVLMDNLFKIIILAIIQGITEFLPVSSSGHLVLAKHFMNAETAHGALLVIVLHSGTLVSILVFYWRHLGQILGGVLRRERDSIRFVLLLLFGCIPAILLAFAAGDQLQEAFGRPRFVSCMLMVTGLFLISTHYAKPGGKSVGWRSALLIGITQMAAMLPGISRSGSTIGIARFLGIDPKQAAEYSFLMSTPLLAGASLLALKDIAKNGNACGSSGMELTIGFLVSAVVGYFSIKWLVSLLRRGRFWRFGIYCLCVGLASFLLLSF